MRNSRGVSTGRKAPEATDNPVQALQHYQEYYLIRLADGTYILAQFGGDYKDKIENGETATLPIGTRKTNTSAAKQYLKDICGVYGADHTYTLYMIDDEWQQEHEFTFFMIKYGAAAAVFVAVAFGLMTVFYKIKEQG